MTQPTNKLQQKSKQLWGDLHTSIGTWNNLHKRGESTLTRFLNAVSLIATSKTQQGPNYGVASAEQHYQRLMEIKKDLRKCYGLMESVFREMQHTIRESESPEVVTNRGEWGVSCSLQDLLDFTMTYLEMYKQELYVKETILEALEYTMNTDILNTYIITWNVQPYLDSKKIEYIKKRVELEQTLTSTK